MDFAAEVGADMASVIDRVVLHTDRPVAEILALEHTVDDAIGLTGVVCAVCPVVRQKKQNGVPDRFRTRVSREAGKERVEAPK